MNDPSDRNRRTFLGLAAGAAASAISLEALPKSTRTMASDVVMMDGTALSRAIAARHLSCVEIMTTYLAHIERVNGAVNALVALQEPDQLLKQAAERDASWRVASTWVPCMASPTPLRICKPSKAFAPRTAHRYSKTSYPLLTV